MLLIKKGEECFLSVAPLNCSFINLGQDSSWQLPPVLKLSLTKTSIVGIINTVAETFFFSTNTSVIYQETRPDNIRSCLSFLCQELWVMHHLLQEANYPHLQLCVQLKVLRSNKQSRYRSLFFPFQKTQTDGKKRQIAGKDWSVPASVWRPSDAAHSGLCWWRLFWWQTLCLHSAGLWENLEAGLTKLHSNWAPTSQSTQICDAAILTHRLVFSVMFCYFRYESRFIECRWGPDQNNICIPLIHSLIFLKA